MVEWLENRFIMFPSNTKTPFFSKITKSLLYKCFLNELQTGDVLSSLDPLYFIWLIGQINLLWLTIELKESCYFASSGQFFVIIPKNFIPYLFKA